MARTPTSPTSIGTRKSMFSTFFSINTAPKSPLIGVAPGEADCLHDEKLESANFTTISARLDRHERALLEELHAAYLSRTEALRTYQATVLNLTDQLTDLRTSNAALKAQLDITSQAHASLLTEITNPNGARSLSPHALSDDGRLSPQSEG